LFPVTFLIQKTGTKNPKKGCFGAKMTVFWTRFGFFRHVLWMIQKSKNPKNSLYSRGQLLDFGLAVLQKSF
jgi:hypothetical protein